MTYAGDDEECSSVRSDEGERPAGCGDERGAKAQQLILDGGTLARVY